jgi:hypothetical protein
MWPVEFWTKEYLTSHPLACTQLRYNTIDAKKGRSVDDFAVIHKAWNMISDQQRARITLVLNI